MLLTLLIIPEIKKYWICFHQGQSYLIREGSSVALVGHPSIDDVTIKIPDVVDVLLHQAALHPIFLYCVV